MQNIKDLQLTGERVLIRVDYNVPIQDGLVVDDYRIRASLPTIKHCLNKGASVVLMSHLGRPEGKIVPEMSLDPVAFALEDILDKEVMFSNDCISDDAVELSQQMKPGEVHLLENLRFHKGETDNDPSFSWYLSRHAGIYINDAFGTAHRSHASNVGITEHMQSAAVGFLIEKEIKYLCESIKNPQSPIVLILGGIKINDKIELINNKITGFEALVRWNSPEKGVLAPYKFIPIAEETNLIIPLGQWIIEQTCIQNKKWHDRGFKLTSAVNISAKQFMQSDLLKIIKNTLSG